MENKNKSSTDAIDSIESRKPNADSLSGDVVIKRARVDSLIIYEITESELDTLINGTQSSLYLNISISAFSFFISFLISLLTCSFENKLAIKTVFISVAVFTIIFATIYFIRWLVARKDLKTILNKIKNRTTN